MKKRHLIAMVACALASATATASAQTGPEVTEQVEPPAPEAPTGPSASLGMDWTTAYYFRGIIQNDEGLILQPYLESGFTLYEGEGGLGSVGLSLGIWNSFHEDTPNNPGAPDAWYEADLYAGLSFGFAGGVSADVVYTAYTSPNGSFDTVHELLLGLGWDDSGIWGSDTFGGIQPSVTIAQELKGTAMGPDEGTYIELAVEPGITAVDNDSVSLGVSVPVTLALGASYYEVQEMNPAGDMETMDDTFGYFAGGLSFGLGLGFVPEQYGEWGVSAGAQVLVLGENLEAINSDGDSTEFIANAGLSVGY